MNGIKKMCYIMGSLGMVSMFLFQSYGAKDSQDKGSIQASLADKVIRLHVIANSDVKRDQELKLKVKDEVVEELRRDLSAVDGKGEAEEIIKSKLKSLESIADSVIDGEGYTYTVKASLEPCWFPIKRYGDMVFPQGIYDALKIEIGKATGKNWWCVMFPSLCFVDETYQVVPEDSKEQLKKELTYEEYKEICKEGKEEVEYRFRLYDWLQEIWD